jgi:ubiquinone/menaquinone biosynthesis C-methylase UbiE
MHKFSPEKAARLENNERHAFLQPESLLRRFGLSSGMTFADIGAGTGFFSRAASVIVGESGHVYAADMSEEMLNSFRAFGLPSNVSLIHSDEYDTRITPQAANLTLAAFVAHENADLKRFLHELGRITGNGGSVLIIDWKRQSEESGPPMEERLDIEDLKKAAGDYSITAFGDLNPSHYFVHLMDVSH